MSASAPCTANTAIESVFGHQEFAHTIWKGVGPDRAAQLAFFNCCTALRSNPAIFKEYSEWSLEEPSNSQDWDCQAELGALAAWPMPQQSLRRVHLKLATLNRMQKLLQAMKFSNTCTAPGLLAILNPSSSPVLEEVIGQYSVGTLCADIEWDEKSRQCALDAEAADVAQVHALKDKLGDAFNRQCMLCLDYGVMDAARGVPVFDRFAGCCSSLHVTDYTTDANVAWYDVLDGPKAKQLQGIATVIITCHCEHDRLCAHDYWARHLPNAMVHSYSWEDKGSGPYYTYLSKVVGVRPASTTLGCLCELEDVGCCVCRSLCC